MPRLASSVIILGVSRLIVPYIQIFALYVVFHGHYSPGGGFQGGALFAASIILERFVLGEKMSWQMFPLRIAMPLGLIGVLLYALVGALGLTSNGAYLDYAALPFNLSLPALRSLGILLIEIGVAMGVCGVLVSIFDQLVNRETV